MAPAEIAQVDCIVQHFTTRLARVDVLEAGSGSLTPWIGLDAS